MLLHFYGFLLGFGILVGIFFIVKTVNNPYYQVAKSYIDQVLLWMLLPGLIGARLYHVIDYWEYYVVDPSQIIFVWQGGLGIFGAIIGAAFGLWLFVKYKKISLELFGKGLDLLAIVLSIGQAIGRWGNYFNQELYGLPTNMPWGIYIRPENRLPGYELFSHFHPLFLYESLWTLFIFLILWRRIKNNKASGTIFLLYLTFYSFGRFWLEFLRLDPWQMGIFTVGQLFSLVLAFFSLLGLVWMFRLDKRQRS